MSKQLALGDKVKDKVTGYTGIVIGWHQWLYGCARLTVQSQSLKDGKPIDNQTFDEPQLELVKSAKVKVKPEHRITGGPRNSKAEKGR